MYKCKYLSLINLNNWMFDLRRLLIKSMNLVYNFKLNKSIINQLIFLFIILDHWKCHPESKNQFTKSSQVSRMINLAPPKIPHQLGSTSSNNSNNSNQRSSSTIKTSTNSIIIMGSSDSNMYPEIKPHHPRAVV